MCLRMNLRFLIVGIMFSAVSSLEAQTIDVDAMQGLSVSAHHRVQSRHVDQLYHVFARLPEGYDTANKYPVVYLLDGGITFPLLAAYYRYLRLGEEVPDLIIVGIGYGTDDWRQGNGRSRDYSAPSLEREHWGGAGAFRKVLADEIIPLIEREYSAAADRRIIFGQSMGGQFVLNAALMAPGLFWGHIASNPALHRNLDFYLGEVERMDGVTEKPRLFVSSGGYDDPVFRQPALAWIKHWTARAPLPWRLKTVTLPRQSHFSAAPMAFRQGLRWLFEDH